MHWSLVKDWFTEFYRSSKCWHIYQKITFINMTTDFIWKSLLSIERLSSSQLQIRVFQNSNFRLKAQISSWATNYCLLKQQFHCSFEKTSTKYPSPNNHSLPVISNKNDVPWKQQLKLKQLHHCYSSRQPLYFGPLQKCSRYTSHSVMHNVE